MLARGEVDMTPSAGPRSNKAGLLASIARTWRDGGLMAPGWGWTGDASCWRLDVGTLIMCKVSQAAVAPVITRHYFALPPQLVLVVSC